MRYPILLLIASIVVAFHMQETVQGFQFSLPGQWGNGGKKRGAFTFSLPGQWGNVQSKRAGGSLMDFKHECEASDLDTLQTAYEYLKTEIERLEMCMEFLGSSNMDVGNKVGDNGKLP